LLAAVEIEHEVRILRGGKSRGLCSVSRVPWGRKRLTVDSWRLKRKRHAADGFGGQSPRIGDVGSKPRDLGNDRGYRVAV
jgi:hypothetical protein